MTPARPLARIFTILCLGVLVAACGGNSASTKTSAADSKDDSADQAESLLVIDGKQIGKDGKVTSDPTLGDATTKAAAKKRVRSATTTDVKWVAPPLLSDGTIDDGPDPFAGERIQVQPIPIEDDPTTTAAIDAEATQMRRVDPATWNAWLGANNQRSPWQQGDDPFANPIVDVVVERCGGARTVATGVVLANETVVTTVHAIETATKRVRIAPTAGDDARLPAMIRYLDVDDDVAVLKVPGLRVSPMPIYTPSGTTSRFGYAYGVANGGLAGTLRRTPVVASVTESSITLEQPDGFAKEISDRSVQTFVGAVTTGFSGGVVALTNDPDLATGFGFHGLIRARVPFRSDTAGILVPSRIVREAITASSGLDEWFEHRPGGCPQWRR